MGGALKFYYCNFHLILNNYYLGAPLRHASGSSGLAKRSVFQLR
jgi:hypothetical protein